MSAADSESRTPEGGAPSATAVPSAHGGRPVLQAGRGGAPAPADRAGAARSGRPPWVYRLSGALLRAWLRVWFQFKAEGAEHVPAEGGCLIASNHCSYLDPPVVGCGVPHRFVRFMARDTLFRSRMFRWWGRHVGVVELDRTRGDIGALKQAIAVLKAGGVLSLFPEGTRSPDGRLQSAKGGVGFLIAKAEVPVVPAFVSGSFAAFPKGARRPARHPITVRYGPAIPPEVFARFGRSKESYERIAAFLMERIAALNE